MKDVAATAGVSIKTVSRVVNNERWVSPDVASRVKGAIADLGYRPDSRARAMRNPGLAGRTIGFIHADIANPFFTAVHSGVEAVAETAGCLILTASSRDSIDREEIILKTFTDRRVDGLIIVPAVDSVGHALAIEQELGRQLPIVFIDRKHHSPADFVGSDNYGGSLRATSHLITHGHHDIAFLGDDPRLHSAQRRAQGFMDAMEHARLRVRLFETGLATEAQAESLAMAMMQRDDRPTAVFCAKNHLTIGVVRTLHQLGLQHEIALVGFDDVPMASVVEPGITTVPQNAPELGRIAAELLLERMNSQRTEPVERIVPVELVLRGSGEIVKPHRHPSGSEINSGLRDA